MTFWTSGYPNPTDKGMALSKDTDQGGPKVRRGRDSNRTPRPDMAPGNGAPTKRQPRRRGRQ